MIIRQLREKAGLNQTQLADRAGIDQTTISKIESGQRRKIHADTLMAVARALNVPVSDLYADENTAQPYSQADMLILQYLKQHLSTDQLDHVASLTQNLTDDELAQLIAQFAQTKPESRKAVLTLLGGSHE